MKSRLFFILVLVITPIISFGQFEHLQFERLSSENGLPSNTINCVHQDSKGYIWFGTYNGLARYDGYAYDIFRVENDKPYSISGNRISAIHEDKSGLLWIGTWRAGINIFDPKTERFTNIRDGKNELSSINIRSIAEDKKGNIWIGTLEGGLNKFDKEDSTFKKITINLPVETESGVRLTHQNITSLQIDEKQNIWMGIENAGILIFNTKTETFKIIDTLCGTSIYTNVSKKLYFDKSGILWMLTNGKGIYSYDTLNQKLNHYDYDIKSNTSFSNYSFTNMVEDYQGNLWFTTNGQGLVIYQPTTKQFTFFKNSDNQKGGLNSNSIYSIFEDNTNIMWLGTFSGGVSIYDPNKKKFEQYHDEMSLQIATKGESVLAVFEDSKKNIWAGTDGGGLFKLDNKTKKIAHYKHDPKKTSSLSTNVIKSIYEDEKGMIWLGTWLFGIDIFNPTTERKVDNINTDNSPIKTNNIWFMYEDSYHDLWISSLGGGLSRKNLNNNLYDYYAPFGDGGVSHNNIMSVFEDNNKSLWIGTEGRGIDIYERETNQFKQHYIFNKKCPEVTCNDIRTIFQDKAGQMWLGTEGAGLILMYSAPDSFQVITTDDGLSSNTIHGMLEDKEGNYWISTTNGISKYKPKTKEFKNFSKIDGLQGDEFNYSASLLTSSGKMIFGGIDGLNIFDPSHIKDNLNSPIVDIIGFSLFNKPIKALDGSGLLKSDIRETDEIVLQYDQSVIEFTFAALNYTLPEKNQYAYKMEGFEKDWNYVGTKRTATYTSLDPGTYTFKVKASNNDGIWNEEGTSITLIILPPFWATWWFRTLVLLFIIIAIFLFIKNRINRFKEESIKLEKLVNEKTKELVAQNKEIIEQRDDLEILAKKVEEANHKKITFFTNISHEIRTPLTLITNPIEKVLSNDTTPANIKEDLGGVKKNTNRLLRLVNQIMDFRKIENESMPVKIIEGDIIQFVTEIKNLYSESAESQNIEYEFNCSIQEKIAWFDADKLEKIIYNLLSNALKFVNTNGKVTVDIEVYSDSAELATVPKIIHDQKLNAVGDFIVITVTNTGEGILEEEIPYMFERFHQLENASKINQPGTGIGLAYSKKIAELHKGDISLESIPNKKTTFTITLPISKVFWEENNMSNFLNYDLSPAVKLTATDIDLPKGYSSFMEEEIDKEKATLLIVEDNPEIQNLIVGLFESQYNILRAVDGVEGCNVAYSHHPDIIISDVNMPNKNGVELCNELKTNIQTSHIPIILLTAKSSKESKIEGLETGADDYITKPFDNDLLKLRVENLLISREKLREKFTANAFSTVADITITSTDEIFMQKATSFVEENINNVNLDIDLLVKELGISRSSLFRKLKSITGQSTKDFINTIRLKYAAQYLIKSDMRISDICYEIGFVDPQYFSKIFKNQFGKTPSEFRKSNKAKK